MWLATEGFGVALLIVSLLIARYCFRLIDRIEAQRDE